MQAIRAEKSCSLFLLMISEKNNEIIGIGGKLSTKLESQSKAVAVIVLVVAVADVETCPGESPRALP